MLLSKVTYSNSYIHSYTDGGHFDMQRGGAGIGTNELQPPSPWSSRYDV